MKIFSSNNTKMKKFSLIKENIRKYADFKGIDIKEIYKNTGIVDGTFSNSSGMSEQNLLKFFSFYSEINLEWLLTGKGEMISSKKRPPQTINSTENRSNLNELEIIQKLSAENALLKRDLEDLKKRSTPKYYIAAEPE